MCCDKDKRIALFAGSFDPFTVGHAALVESSLRLFDRVVIGVGRNITKQSLLSFDRRRELIADYYCDDDRVEVVTYDGLTGDFARTKGATVLVRGVRNTLDLETERTLEAVNRSLYPELQTVMMFTPAEYSHISSSCVRELLAFGRDVSEMMPRGVNIMDYIKKN